MNSLPRITLTRSGAGWLVTCSCGFERFAARRPAADRVARDHEAGHERKRRRDD